MHQMIFCYMYIHLTDFKCRLKFSRVTVPEEKPSTLFFSKGLLGFKIF